MVPMIPFGRDQYHSDRNCAKDQQTDAWILGEPLVEEDIEKGTDDRSFDRSDSSNDRDKDQSDRPIDSKGTIRLNKDVMKVENTRNACRSRPR